MAYVERRGKKWRVRYKLPDGGDGTRSGFETKTAALTWGRDQEAAARNGTWTDPGAGKITVEAWITRWLRLQDVGLSTEVNREYLLRRFILPTWGARPLNSLATEEITDWENRLPRSKGIARRTAHDARSLFCTILGDAAATRPPLIPYNPALRPRNRGRRTGRRIDRSPPRAWTTPLEALLIAEAPRCCPGPATTSCSSSPSPTPGCVGPKRSASNAATCSRGTSTLNGSSAKSTGSSTGCRPRTTPTAAPAGSRRSPSTCHPSWPGCSPVKPPPAHASAAPARRSTAAVESTPSSAATAATSAAATTHGASSVPPPTAATCHKPGAPATSSSWTPPPGPADPSQPGHRHGRERPSARRRDAASSTSTRRHRSRRGCRSGPV